MKVRLARKISYGSNTNNYTRAQKRAAFLRLHRRERKIRPAMSAMMDALTKEWGQPSQLARLGEAAERAGWSMGEFAKACRVVQTFEVMK